MKKLLIGLLLVVAVLALAIELIAPRLAASSIEDHVRAQTEGAAGVSADVGTFPVVTRLLATERVRRLGVTFDELAGQQLTFASVRLELRGVQLDREALLAGDVRVRGMQGGQATATLDADALSQGVGAPVRIEGERVFVEVAGTEVEVPTVIQGRALALPAGLPAITLPDLVPCTDIAAAAQDGRIQLSCTLDDVPHVLT